MPLTSAMACGHPMYQDVRGKCACPRCLPLGSPERTERLAHLFDYAALGDDKDAGAARQGSKESET